jgi:hypothetical protein
VAVQYVRVEVEEGRAYTYTWDGDRPLGRGDRVVLPGNIVHDREFEGTVLRTLTDEQVADDGYKGEYKGVLRRAEPVLAPEDADLL